MRNGREDTEFSAPSEYSDHEAQWRAPDISHSGNEAVWRGRGLQGPGGNLALPLLSDVIFARCCSLFLCAVGTLFPPNEAGMTVKADAFWKSPGT